MVPHPLGCPCMASPDLTLDPGMPTVTAACGLDPIGQFNPHLRHAVPRNTGRVYAYNRPHPRCHACGRAGGHRSIVRSRRSPRHASGGTLRSALWYTNTISAEASLSALFSGGGISMGCLLVLLLGVLAKLCFDHPAAAPWIIGGGGGIVVLFILLGIALESPVKVEPPRKAPVEPIGTATFHSCMRCGCTQDGVVISKCLDCSQMWCDVCAGGRCQHSASPTVRRVGRISRPG